MRRSTPPTSSAVVNNPANNEAGRLDQIVYKIVPDRDAMLAGLAGITVLRQPSYA